jgi:transposase-like protein
MGKKDKNGVSTRREFKAKAVALAEKREKPVSQIAADLGINESMLHR